MWYLRVFHLRSPWITVPFRFFFKHLNAGSLEFSFVCLSWIFHWFWSQFLKKINDFCIASRFASASLLQVSVKLAPNLHQTCTRPVQVYCKFNATFTYQCKFSESFTEAVKVCTKLSLIECKFIKNCTKLALHECKFECKFDANVH